MTEQLNAKAPDNLERLLIDVLSDHERLDRILGFIKGVQQLGEYDPHKKRIVLHRRASVYERRRTLVHECLHAYFDTHEIPADEDDVIRETESIMRRIYGVDYGKKS